MNDLISISEIGRRLGLSRQTVHMWHIRRNRNRFPEPAAFYTYNSRECPLFDWPMIQEWYKNYVPSSGGRPRNLPVDMTL